MSIHSSAIDIKMITKTVEILTKTLAADMYGFAEDDSSVLDSSFLVCQPVILRGGSPSNLL